MERLFFDVDGVLLNFEHAFVVWLNELYGLGLPESYETPSWYFDDILSPEQCREAWTLFLESPAAGRMNPYLDAERFNALTAGRSVHLLTNFPEHQFHRRVENLALLGFRYASMHHCGFHAFKSRGVASKSATISRIMGPGERALFLDDHPDNCVDVVQNCERVEVWLMTRRFNREFAHPAVRRARDWGCVIERLEREKAPPAPAGHGRLLAGK
jgi:FMN phosphatase YigB (HAD superfamily)